MFKVCFKNSETCEKLILTCEKQISHVFLIQPAILITFHMFPENTHSRLSHVIYQNIMVTCENQ